MVQRLLDSSASLPAFLNDLLTTQAVMVAGTEAAAFIVDKQGEQAALKAIAHIRPDESDANIRQQAIAAFQGILKPCVEQGKDGAIEVGSPDGGEPQFCLVTVLRNEGEIVAASAVITRARDMERAKQRLQSMQLVAGYFELFSLRRFADQARQVADRHQQVLQYASAVGTAEGFESAAMNLCNELANRTGASRVSVGWMKGKDIKVKALSHTEKFDKKQELIVQLEKVMEECVDQEEPVKFDPAGQSSGNVTRAAKELSRTQGGNGVLSYPLRRREEIVGVVTLEFPPGAPIDAQIEASLGVGAELLAPQLADRYDNDRFIVTKMGLSLREGVKMAVGPKHWGVKLIIVAVLALLGVVTFVKMPYRVRSGFQLVALQKASVCAPYDGFLEEILKRPGEFVKKGEVIARLKIFDYEMKWKQALSQVTSKLQEANNYRTARKIGEMQVALAEAAQYQEQAKLLKWQMDQAELKAPFDGVLQKGDLYDRKGAPVKYGDVLFELAETDAEGRIATEAEIAIPERDIQDVKAIEDAKEMLVHEKAGTATAQEKAALVELRKHHASLDRVYDGAISTTSFPSEDSDITVTRIVPLGEPKEGENVFKVYGSIHYRNANQANWMHPGLAGEARINTLEKKSIGWIWTHRLVDWLKLKMWI
jgi:multidrug resistance efflux pump